jgi:uridine kinase
MRHLVANSSKRLIKTQTHNSKQTKYEWNIMRDINQKLQDHNSIIAQADKGKTIVITQKQEYDQFINTFINNNDFMLLPQDPTNTFQRSVKESINPCRMLIKKKLQQ